MQYDPESGQYRLVRQHDSWLSIDPVAGCSYSCRYCILRIDGLTGVRPRHLLNSVEAVTALTTNRRFIPSDTVVSFGNNTDAFLPANIGGTLQFLEQFRSAGYDNPVAIATKAPIGAGLADELRAIGGPRLLIFLSYSGLPAAMEKGVNHQRLKANFRTLAAAGVNVLHFWRPLIAANSTSEAIANVLEAVAPFSRASVCIGLKYGPSLLPLFRQTPELTIPDEKRDGDAGNYMACGIAEAILTFAARRFPSYPVYFRTSCAVAHAVQRTDYTATFGGMACTASLCPVAQRGACSNKVMAPNRDNVDRLLARLGIEAAYRVTPESVQFSDELHQEDYVFLVHNLRCRVRARIRRMSEWSGHILCDNRPLPRASNSCFMKDSAFGTEYR